MLSAGALECQFIIHNTGNVPLTNITVIGDTDNCTKYTLALPDTHSCLLSLPISPQQLEANATVQLNLPVYASPATLPLDVQYGNMTVDLSQVYVYKEPLPPPENLHAEMQVEMIRDSCKAPTSAGEQLLQRHSLNLWPCLCRLVCGNACAGGWCSNCTITSVQTRPGSRSSLQGDRPQLL